MRSLPWSLYMYLLPSCLGGFYYPSFACAICAFLLHCLQGVILCWGMSAGALVLLVHLQLCLLSSLWVDALVRIPLFPSVCVLICIGFCGGSLFCSTLCTPRTFAWFLVLASAYFMVLLPPHAKLRALLLAVQVSTQDNIPSCHACQCLMVSGGCS